MLNYLVSSISQLINFNTSNKNKYLMQKNYKHVKDWLVVKSHCIKRSKINKNKKEQGGNENFRHFFLIISIIVLRI